MLRNLGCNTMLFIWFTVLYIISSVNAHISLTFPPARKYDLDFLDNGRTKAPCGMPKGTLKTTILAGKQFNITWHLAYPHRGGFRLQVLDNLLRPVLDLTPVTAKSEFVSGDPTLQYYPVQIPRDFECDNCTIRLLREAKEWGDNYRLWSCADVDIRTKNNYKEDCSGHGPYLLSKCRCNRLYRGPRCQYKDECVDHIDCGDMGRCVDIRSTSLPSKQCFCEHGWFGPACTKKSPVKSATIDLSGHQEKRLSENVVLYWRILEEEKEIEMVMVGNVTSYMGIGWRPLNITEECHNFPHLEDPEGYNPTSYKHEQVVNNKLPTESSNEPQSGMMDSKSQIIVTPHNKQNIPIENLKSDVIYFNNQESKNIKFKSEVDAPLMDELEKQKESEAKREINPRYIASRVTRDDFRLDPDEEISVATRVSYQVSSSKSVRARSKRQEPHAKDILGPYAPRNDFSPMDCTDMVIGMAHGTSFRIWDYYSRDRSTPRLDTFWGGKNDLTAAMGFEKDGVTTIVFRKKLKGNEPTDHTIQRGPMHVIWAVGQEIGHYIHSPKSGLETESTGMKEFYKPDELKYHGHGNQRGVLNINFYQMTGSESKTTNEEGSGNNGKWTKCKGSWSYPKDCNVTEGDCMYYASWHLRSRTGRIHFTLMTTNTNTWTGIAFSKDHKMSQTDAIIGWVDKAGRPFMMDTWIVGQTAPRLDVSQDITNITCKTVDGVTTLTFERNPDTGDKEQDLEFTENSCLYMMFPVMGGDFNPVNKRIRKHKSIPSITASKVCLSFCQDGDDESTPKPPPHNAYLMRIRLRNLGTGFKVPRMGTDEFNILGNTVTTGFKNTVSKLSTFKSLKVDEFSEEGDAVEAKMVLEVFKDESEKRKTIDEQNDNIYQLFEETVSYGRVGSLSIDPTYFIFEPIEMNKGLIAEGDSSDIRTSETKLWIVLGCIIALLVMAFMQAVCTICKAFSSKSSSHKEMLAHSSAWKDYSTANTNYAFEPYEAEEKVRIGLMSGTNGSSMQVQDTRSLSRPRNSHGLNAAAMSRPAYSLPRSQPPAYSRNHAIDHHGPVDRHLQPDFYFMPSQRKYSGEVVRVYVDYNNSNK